MTAKRKTPARSKAPAARSAVSMRGTAANDAMTPAPAPSLIKASLAYSTSPALIKVASLLTLAPAPAPEAVKASPALAAPAKSERAESDAVNLAPRPKISNEERHRMIAKVAYDYAERARFGSDPVKDWLAAEREIDSMLARVAC